MEGGWSQNGDEHGRMFFYYDNYFSGYGWIYAAEVDNDIRGDTSILFYLELPFHHNYGQKLRDGTLTVPREIVVIKKHSLCWIITRGSGRIIPSLLGWWLMGIGRELF